MALLHITDASGRKWQFPLTPQGPFTIGRAPDNQIVLNDPRASRYHAHVKFQQGGYFIVDGSPDGRLSANHVFVGGEQRYEHPLRDGDRVTIGASQLQFDTSDEQKAEPPVPYDDRPLGHTQMLVSANEVIRAALSSRHPAVARARLRRMITVSTLLVVEFRSDVFPEAARIHGWHSCTSSTPAGASGSSPSRRRGRAPSGARPTTASS